MFWGVCLNSRREDQKGWLDGVWNTEGPGGYLDALGVGWGHWGSCSLLSGLCGENMENEWDSSVVRKGPGQVEKGVGSGSEWMQQH